MTAKWRSGSCYSYIHLQRFDVGCHRRDIGEAKLSSIALNFRILIKLFLVKKRRKEERKLLNV